MTWKRKSPQARRRQLRRKAGCARRWRRWSYAVWVEVNRNVYLRNGFSRREATRAARLAARYVVGRGTERELIELLEMVRRLAARYVVGRGTEREVIELLEMVRDHQERIGNRWLTRLERCEGGTSRHPGG